MTDYPIRTRARARVHEDRAGVSHPSSAVANVAAAKSETYPRRRK